MPYFQRTLGQRQTAPQPQGVVDPWDEIIRKQVERVDALDQRPPMYSPEEIAQRRAQNEREYDVGIYGMLSGNQNLAELGGTVFKNALAQRAPKVTERGTVDPITGEFKYDTDYLRRGEQDKLDRMMLFKAQNDERRSQRERDFENRVFLKTLAAGGGGGGGVGAGTASPIGVDAQGNTVFRPSKGGALFKYGPDGQPIAHAEAVLPKPTGGGPSEDERKAAGWLSSAEKAWADIQKVLKENPGASQIPAWEKVVEGTLPTYGPSIANKFRDQHRQRFIAASKAMSESMLRAATGAGYNLLEAKDSVEALTPVYGEEPETTKQKLENVPLFLQGLRARAGRAALPPVPGANVPPLPGQMSQPRAAGAAPAGPDPADPWGLFQKGR